MPIREVPNGREVFILNRSLHDKNGGVYHYHKWIWMYELGFDNISLEEV